MPAVYARISPALRVGLIFGAIGLALTVVGIVRGNVPMNPASIAMALLIGGGVWFLVSWAVATAAVDVESDLAQSDQEQEG
jgi:putative Mn2+ efflux pump MntP